VFALFVALLLLASAGTLGAQQKKDPLSSDAFYRRLAGEIEAENIRRAVHTLASFGSRVTGYPGERKAARWILNKFKEIGLKDVKGPVHFDVPVPVDEGAELQVEAGVPANPSQPSTLTHQLFKLYPLWPNLVRTSQTPPQGIEGKLIYAGKGSAAEYNGKDVQGSIVLLDYFCGTDWFNAPLLGAKAVIFIDPHPQPALRGEAEAKFLTTPIHLPRFYVDAATGKALKEIAPSSPRVRLRCRMQWQERPASRITGVIPGKDPTLKDEWIILHGYFDSMSVVPSLSPGAEQACGMATLLEVARVLAKQRPARSILVVASSGHCQNLADARYFFDALKKPNDKKAEEEFKKYKAFISFDLTSRTPTVGTFYKGHFIDQDESVLQSRFSDLGTRAREIARQVGVALGWIPRELSDAEKQRVTALVKKNDVDGALALITRGLDAPSRANVALLFKEEVAKFQKKEKEKPSSAEEYQKAVEGIVERTREQQFDLFYADAINPIKGKDWRTYLPGGKFAFASEIATLATKPGLSFVTVNDARLAVDTPHDTADRVQFDNVVKQAKTIVCVLYDFLRTQSDSFAQNLDDNFARVKGYLYWFDPNRSYMPDQPVRGGIAVARVVGFSNKSFAGVRGEWFDLVNKGEPALGEAEKGAPERAAREIRIMVRVVLTVAALSLLLWCYLDWRAQQQTPSPSRHTAVYVLTVLISLATILVYTPVFRFKVPKRAIQQTRREEDAKFLFVGMPNVKARGLTWSFEGYKTDEDTGDIVFAPDRGNYGAEQFPVNLRIDLNDKQLTVVLFPCVAMSIFDMVDQRQFALLHDINILDAASDSTPFYFGHSLPLPQPLVSSFEPLAVVYGKPDAHLKVTMGASILGLRFILLNNDREKYLQWKKLRKSEMSLEERRKLEEKLSPDTYLGRGFRLKDHPSISNTPYQVAWDMWILDDFRLESFRKFGISNKRVDTLHQLAYDSLQEAEKWLREKKYDKFLTEVRTAWSYEAKAYPDVQGTANDVVKGILFYMFLLLPFAYAAERLFFAASALKPKQHWAIMGFLLVYLIFYPMPLAWRAALIVAWFFLSLASEKALRTSAPIVRQIFWTVFVFFVVFLIIMLVHPAFHITITPVVVLLAFVILALTVVVAGIITQKFEDQMRQIKFETTGIHTADVGRFGASAAAFSLGIANMRRRKARTALTCLTLILLTFTVLSFTSVVAGRRVNKVPLESFNVENISFILVPYGVQLSMRIVFSGVALGFITWCYVDLRRRERRIVEEEKRRVTTREKLRRGAIYAFTGLMAFAAILSFTPLFRTEKPKLEERHIKPPYNGILIRDRSWVAVGEPMTRIVRAEFGDRYPVAPRAWYFSSLVGQQSFVNLAHGDTPYGATALVGMDAMEPKVTEIDRALIKGRWFQEGEILACIVPSGMAKVLGITADDVGKTTVKVLGEDLPVIGIFDSAKLKNIKDLDGEPLTPVDYVLMQERRRQGGDQGGVSQGELEEYVHLDPDAVLFTTYQFVMDHGGDLRSLALNFDKPLKPLNAEERAEIAKLPYQKFHSQGAKLTEFHLNTMMERVELNLFAGIDGNTYLVSAMGATSFAGTENVFIPILIAALIVLNTMMGSVFERTNEIGIFGSLGLAPVHIAMLFIAEAFVYAVLGAISGYLVGQVTAKVLVDGLTVGGFPLIPGGLISSALNLNYSSLSAVGTTIIIMATVLLSTLYPARKASEMSVPSVERRWKLPPPEGDVLRVQLPFTVSSGQTLGLNVFLKEYLEAHADYSLGHFSVDKVELSPIETDYGRGWRLEAMVWLAPYDLGVSEYMTLDTVPTEDTWVNEVHITIRRESGDEASWLRVTRNYLNMVRKQFLLWRTFRPELKERYEQQGQEMMVN
jgi:hypothetical protein